MCSAMQLDGRLGVEGIPHTISKSRGGAYSSLAKTPQSVQEELSQQIPNRNEEGSENKS